MLEITRQEGEKPDYSSLKLKLGIKVIAWNDRMLAALVNGVKGNKWFSLIDKVISQNTMLTAWNLVAKNKGAAGVDKVTIEKFEKKYAEYLTELINEVKASKYKPNLIKRVYIPKGKGEMRPLGIPCVKDRTLQCAIKLIIEPLFEYEFVETSYGFRPGRGCKDALRKIQENLDQGYVHIVDADLKSYFDTIPHDRLMKRIEERISDGKVLNLIQGYLKQGIMEECKEWTPTVGSPQGAVLSPLCANIYLHPLDKLMEARGLRMVRYADDFVIMCKTEEEALDAFKVVSEWIQENGLILHPDKTHIGNCLKPGQGFEFLGYRFEKGERHIRKKSLDKFKNKIRELTRRNNSYNIKRTIEKINPTLIGWFGYFKHAHKWIFERIDSWIRRRMRSIKRRQNKGNGLGKTLNDHIKWPNKYFAELGLFSLKDAHQRAISA